ncbi:GMC family oxidoreductase [Salinarimonas ramus]|uniref:Choline dehydrogenase n=1 Tax=Salinarimonas ramus TaxID=690164 RepID=A0A917Q9J2_9HYPH|nr:GMC family oxidoreductase N-terminal domain-containing protein [Salinarimonas ramus]GGK34280.1 choline dehydrogenase [Salinarimonas ramus]
MRDFGTFDYIVVGAGSAGCVVANRLSRDPSARVLVLEAGGKDDWIWFHIPVGYLFAIGNPRADWMLKTEPVPGLNGRTLAYPRGKVIGGSSAINAMIYMRGQAQDYDGWRQLGLDGWGWEDVKPIFLQHQDHARPDAHHAGGGEWRVDYPRVRWDLLDAVIEACVAAGIPATDDFNRGDNSGVGYFQVNQKGGRRWSSARGFLAPALGRPNLRLETGIAVERVVIEDGRATGVVFRQGGETCVAHAGGEVILCAGAIKSPQLLELSGIGDGARLQALGVETKHHAPGVGENLQDHLQLRPIFKVEGVRTLNEDYGKLWRRAWMGLEYALFRRGPLTMAPSQLGAFARSSPDYETPNLQFHFQPLSLDKFGDAPHPFPAFTASVCNLRPSSRGSVHATSPDPHAPPAIQPNYLDTHEDRRVAADSIRLVRRIVAQAPLARFRPTEYRPGPEIDGEEALAQAAGEIGTTIFHPVGTAKMGPSSDPSAVLDGRLRVHGVAGLRVVDASAMPRITSGNTNSPTIMIAEKACAMILEARRA